MAAEWCTIEGPEIHDFHTLRGQYVVVVYSPEGDNELHLYDQNLAPILDKHALFHAERVIISNTERVPNTDITGYCLLRQEVNLVGGPRQGNILTLRYRDPTTLKLVEFVFNGKESLSQWYTIHGTSPELQEATLKLT